MKGLGGLAKAIRRDMKGLEREVRRARVSAARQTAHYVARNMPIAFGELRKSLHVEVKGGTTRGTVRTIADAPHAAAVEVGSRPHWVPLQPLLDWVKLRGTQGIDAWGGVRSAMRKAWGTTTAKAAHRVATDLKQLERSGRPLSGDHLDVNAPLSLAKAIQAAIAKNGTRPHAYMRNALPFAKAVLNEEVKAALRRVNAEDEGVD